MARTTGPLFSFDASGTVGKAITFSRWKGRPYVRQRVIPSNPKAALQVSTRAMMKFLSQGWAALSAPNKATWDTLAAGDAISGFNAYCRFNLKAWTQFLSPSKVYPAVRTTTPDSTIGQSATGGVGQVTIAVTAAAIATTWGLLVFRGATGFATARGNLIGATVIVAGDTAEFIDTGLTAGTYYYKLRTFGIDGLIGTQQTEINAAAT